MALLLVVGTVSSVCPKTDLITPCLCHNDEIHCGGNKVFNLSNVFERMKNGLAQNAKHFKLFHLNNTAITELKETQFRDITFDEILIESCKQLKTIHRNAFIETDIFTKSIIIKENPAFTSPDGSIFEAMTKFINVEYIYLINNNITEIPEKAFQRTVGYQEKLTDLVLMGKSINKLGNHAFYHLRKLTNLYIENTSLTYIPEYALEFEESSSQTLYLYLGLNRYLDSSKLAEFSLSKFKRPTTFVLEQRSDNYFNYLDEKVFSPFFKQNESNKVRLHDGLLNCSDCRNQWLRNEIAPVARVLDAKCSGGKNLTDPANFLNCGISQYSKNCRLDKALDTIHCGGNTKINLKEVFGNFSQTLESNEKYFLNFVLNNTSIDIIEDNTFHDIRFGDIVIDSCTNLRRIHENAFTATNLKTRTLQISNNSHLGSENNLIFKIASKFLNLENLYLVGNNISEVPENAFQPIVGYQDRLNNLVLKDDNTLKRIGSQAFSSLNNLYYMEIHGDLAHVDPGAFSFEKSSDKNLRIAFIGHQWTNGSVFANDSLIGIKRPTTLVFFRRDSREMVYLNETVFLPFLLEDRGNKIDLEGDHPNCNDCRNYWLRKRVDLQSQIKPNPLTCVGDKVAGNDFNNLDNFKGCNKF